MGNSVDAEQGPVLPMTFIACVSDEATLKANLLASPCLGPGSPHQVLLYRGAASAAEGLNRGLEQARHRPVVCVHQDVYLPRGWDARLVVQLHEAQRTFGPIGVAGAYGVSLLGGRVLRAGCVVDRDRLLNEPAKLPSLVETLDELLLVLPEPSTWRFDSSLGWHFYGADVCLQARSRGLHSVALDVVCLHHSRSVGLPLAFFASGRVFARKWSEQLPVATSCVVVGRDWLQAPGPAGPW
jgi:hypothetical protein